MTDPEKTQELTILEVNPGQSGCLSFSLSEEEIELHYDEALPLLRAHHEEVLKDLPFSPDKEWYIAAERAGLVKAYVARNEFLAMIGYAVFLIRDKHPHTGARWALCDSLYLMPSYRNHGIAAKLVQFSEERLRSLADVVSYSLPHQAAFGKALEKLGYAPAETLYRRKLQ